MTKPVNPIRTVRVIKGPKRPSVDFYSMDLAAQLSHVARGGGHVFCMWVVQHFENAILFNHERRPRAIYFHGDPNQAVSVQKSEDVYIPGAWLIVRDYYNCMASRRKAGFVIGPDVWLDVVQEAPADKIILLHRFLAEPLYRAEVTRLIGLPAVDPDLTKVWHWGGGSSFDGLTKPGPELDLANRWRVYARDPVFRRKIRSAEAAEVNRELFGWALEEKGGELCLP